VLVISDDLKGMHVKIRIKIHMRYKQRYSFYKHITIILQQIPYRELAKQKAGNKYRLLTLVLKAIILRI